MSTRNRTRALGLLIAALCLATGALAAGLSGSTTPQIGGGLSFGTDGGIGGPGGVVVPQPTGKILAVDGSSFILQTDATSKICRAGGC